MEPIKTHVKDALGRLVESLKEKPRIEGLLKALVSRTKELENQLFGLYEGTRLEQAEGAQLDQIGELVGQEREGVTDSVYRTRIRARVAANRSRGRFYDILRVLKTLEPDAFIHLSEFPPASFLAVFEGVTVSEEDAAIYAEFLKMSRSAGVNAQLLSSEFSDGERFSLVPVAVLAVSLSAGSNPTASVKVDSTKGFSDSGVLVLNLGESGEEQLTYGSKTDTSFEQVSLNSNDVDAGAQIVPRPVGSLSLSDFPTLTGGHLMSIKQA